jgi:GntR family transcriptional regulator
LEKTVPMYERIHSELLHAIQSGELRPGDTVPTEKELQRQYDVSRAPVRQALTKLERAGFILRTPGRGTEVIHPQIAPWAKLSGFAHFYSRIVDRLKIRTLAVETLGADPEVAAHLGVDPGQLVLRVTRLRLVEGKPVAYIQNFLKSELGVDAPDSGSVTSSLHQLVRQVMDRDEVEVQEDLVAQAAPESVATMLEVAPGTPLLAVTRRGWDSKRLPVEFSRYWALTESMSYRSILSARTQRRALGDDET